MGILFDSTGLCPDNTDLDHALSLGEQPFHPRHKRNDRAWRRADATRIKRNRSRYLTIHEPTPHRVGMMLHTATPCSCFMCCNPRRNGDITRQELRAIVTHQEQLKEAAYEL